MGGPLLSMWFLTSSVITFQWNLHDANVAISSGWSQNFFLVDFSLLDQDTNRYGSLISWYLRRHFTVYWYLWGYFARTSELPSFFYPSFREVLICRIILTSSIFLLLCKRKHFYTLNELLQVIAFPFAHLRKLPQPSQGFSVFTHWTPSPNMLTIWSVRLRQSVPMSSFGFSYLFLKFCRFSSLLSMPPLLCSGVSQPDSLQLDRTVVHRPQCCFFLFSSILSLLVFIFSCSSYLDNSFVMTDSCDQYLRLSSPLLHDYFSDYQFLLTNRTVWLCLPLVQYRLFMILLSSAFNVLVLRWLFLRL